MKKLMRSFGPLRLKRCLACLLALLFALCSAGCACAGVTLGVVGAGVQAFLSASGPSAPPVRVPARTAAPTQPPEGAGASAADPAPSASAAHAQVPFSEMAYERPDLDALSELLTELLLDEEKGVGTETLLDRYDEALARFNAADSMLSLCYVRYAHDVSDEYYREEYAYLETELNALDLAMTDVSLALLSRGDEARARWGDGFADCVLRGDALNSEAIQPLLEREQKLTMEYDALLSAFVLEDGGRTYTAEQISELAAQDYEAYVRLFDAYYFALNGKAGKIFLELLSVRSEIAGALGYDSYADYRYDCYERDYSVSDAKALHDAVKKHLVPLYRKAVIKNTLSGYDIYADTFAHDVFLEQLRTAMADFSPLALETLDYLQQYGLYDHASGGDRMQSSFSTFFSDYGAPFLFAEWTGSYQDTSTLVHELGHCINYYQNPAVGWSVSDPLDLAEIDSQGLEMLTMPYYASFYGSPKAVRSARLNRCCDMLYAVISGCMEDEFQQIVYSDPAMTLAQMNAAYLRLAEAYGFADLYGYTGTEWVQIPHTFQSPLYYISYATSALGAMQLFELSERDRAAAGEAYLSILMREPYARFRQTLKKNGLSDPFSESTVEELAEVLDAAIDR